MIQRNVHSSRSPLMRFLALIRPQLKLVGGAALMGIGKFTLPLVFPLAFKYVVDVLVSSRPKLDAINLVIDHWCSRLCHLAGLISTPESKLAALSITLLTLYALQAIASYYRNYWAGVAGNRLIFGLQCNLFSHLQQ